MGTPFRLNTATAGQDHRRANLFAGDWRALRKCFTRCCFQLATLDPVWYRLRDIQLIHGAKIDGLLPDREPAVDHEVYACHIGGGAGGKKEQGAAQILSGCHAA